jgi:hypothetical protein
VLDPTSFMIELPSKRVLRYWRPGVKMVKKKVQTVDEEGEIIEIERESRDIQFYTPGKDTMNMLPESTYSGKLCLAAGSLVLTDRGWSPIKEVTTQERVHDGVEFVTHGGILCNGLKQCMSLDGVWMTPDHEVLTDEGWKAASLVSRPYRPAVRSSDRLATVAQQRQNVAVALGVPMRATLYEEGFGRSQRGQARGVSKLRVLDQASAVETEDPRDVEASCVRSVPVDDRSLPVADASGMAQLRSSGDSGLREVGVLRELLGRHGPEIQEGADPGSDRQRQGILPRQLPMDQLRNAKPQPAREQGVRHAVGADHGGGGGRTVGDRCDDAAVSSRPQVARGEAVPSSRFEQLRCVYDITNCGPRRRFVVLGQHGPLIVHNCENVTQAVARDLLADATVRLEAAGYPPVVHVHDSIACEVPAGFGNLDEFCSIMAATPDWAPGLPIEAKGYRDTRFRG